MERSGAERSGARSGVGVVENDGAGAERGAGGRGAGTERGERGLQKQVGARSGFFAAHAPLTSFVSKMSAVSVCD